MVKGHHLNILPVAAYIVLESHVSSTGRWLMSSSPRSESKSNKNTNAKTIGTHDGRICGDEALACYMLKVLPEYQDARYMYVG